jgi:putative ABC transport system permease protein
MIPASVRFFRLLLRLYPRRFRDLYGADMEAFFVDRWRNAGGTGRRMSVWGRTALNMAATGAAERWRSSLVHRERAHASLVDQEHTGGFVNSLLQDTRFALRLLRRQPVFAVFVALTLAVGIGANTAVFSVVNGVLLRPLPFPASDRLVAVWGRFDPESGFDFPQFPLSNPEFVDYRAQSRAFEDMAAFSTRAITVGGAGAESQRIPGAAVTANLFSVLRVQPAIGRPFTAEEDKPMGRAVALIGHGYWLSRFGGDRLIAGRVVPMNGVATTIVGVMPEGFAYPGTTTRVWVPLRIDAANPGNRKGHGTQAIGRLKEGVSFERARAELGTIMAGWKAQYPDIHTGHYLFIRPLIDDVAGTIRPALLILLGATGFVLLIVCANVANVLMARGEARMREMAIRGALGARRGRLIRLSLIESAVLGVAGGALGLGLAHAAVRALVALDPDSIPRAAEVGIDGRMLLFAAAVSLVSALAAGLMPALRGASPDLQSTLRESSQATTGSISRLWFRKSLVAIEVALCAVLVIGAGLMVRSLDRLFAVDPGFRAEGLLMAGLAPPAADYKEPARVNAFYTALLARVRQLPGVQSASVTSGVPLWTDSGVWDFEIEGRPAPAAGAIAWNAGAEVVAPGYFETLGTPLVSGRFFASTDAPGGMPVAIVNESMAARFFAGENPIGRRIRVSGNTTKEAWMTIVGIAGNVRDRSLDAAPRPLYYLLHAQVPVTLEGSAFRSMSLVVRVSGAPDATIKGVRGIVRQLDPSLPVFDVQSIDVIIGRSVARPRFLTAVLSLFAVIGLVLGASGIYGVLSYTVSRRTHELGIRRALGAAPARLLRDVIVQGMEPVAAGLAIGIAASLWVTRLLGNQLFGVSPTDLPTYAIVIAGVVAVSLAACAFPARRALRVNPIIALRSE